MAGGPKVLYNNQPIEVLNEAAKKSIVNKVELVWLDKRFSISLDWKI